jgi:hypothetical protein
MIGHHEEIDWVPAGMSSLHPIQRALDYRVRRDTLRQKPARGQLRKIQVKEDSQRMLCILPNRLVEELPYI